MYRTPFTTRVFRELLVVAVCGMRLRADGFPDGTLIAKTFATIARDGSPRLDLREFYANYRDFCRAVRMHRESSERERCQIAKYVLGTKTKEYYPGYHGHTKGDQRPDAPVPHPTFFAALKSIFNESDTSAIEAYYDNTCTKDDDEASKSLGNRETREISHAMYATIAVVHLDARNAAPVGAEPEEYMDDDEFAMVTYNAPDGLHARDCRRLYKAF